MELDAVAGLLQGRGQLDITQPGWLYDWAAKQRAADPRLTHRRPRASPHARGLIIRAPHEKDTDMPDAPRRIDPGRLSLLMDALLTEASPAVREEFRRRLTASATPGFDDQVRAATAETHDLVTAVTRNLDGGQRSASLPADVPAWVRLGMLDALAQWASGSGSTCIHEPHPARPEPITAVAWKTGLVACPPCGGRLFKLPLNSEADRTCDGCGRITRGVEDDGGITAIIVRIGALLYTVGACSDCRWGPDRPTT